MKSFQDYTKEKANPQEKTATAEELTKQIAAAYNGKSNATMLKNILREAERSKRAGTLTNAEIESFFLAFEPMLDNVQRKRLRAVVDRLKEI